MGLIEQREAIRRSRQRLIRTASRLARLDDDRRRLVSNQGDSTSAGPGRDTASQAGASEYKSD